MPFPRGHTPCTTHAHSMHTKGERPMTRILTLNVGSSSLKISLHEEGARLGAASVESIGPRARLRMGEARDVEAPDHAAAFAVAMEALDPGTPDAVAHRIVHGGALYAAPTRLTPQVVARLREMIPLAPLHQPPALAVIGAAMLRFEEALHVGCFDTAFHAAKPEVHDWLPLPGRFHERGLRRYGFHGLACASVVHALGGDLPGRLVIAHLGNGASVTAVRDGVGQSNSMGFSTLDGLMMGTRSGSIDPGVLIHLLREGMELDALEELLYAGAGLKGVSGVSNDMRVLMASDEPRAAFAREMFAQGVAEGIARAAVVLGGVDALVFSGGIGENDTAMREMVLALTAPIGAGADKARVVEADGEGVLARAAAAMLEAGG